MLDISFTVLTSLLCLENNIKVYDDSKFSQLFTGNKKVFAPRQWHPTPVLLPGEFHGWRSLVGCSPWGRWGSDTTERLHFHFSLSWIGEGNGNPLQYSCLESSMDSGAWQATVHGVAKSWTWLTLTSIYLSICIISSLFIYPSRTRRLFLYLGYCKQCCSEHWGACILLS